MKLTYTWRKISVYLRMAFLWVITQQVAVIFYRGFGTTSQSQWVITQRCPVLIYFVTET